MTENDLPSGKEAVEIAEKWLKKVRAETAHTEKDAVEDYPRVFPIIYGPGMMVPYFPIVPSIAKAETSFQAPVPDSPERLNERWRNARRMVGLKTAGIAFGCATLVESIIVGTNPSMIPFIQEHPQLLVATLAANTLFSVHRAVRAMRR